MSKYNSPETGDFDNYFISDVGFLNDFLKPNSLWLWGGNSRGQLGQSNTTQRSSPVQVLGINGGKWNSVSLGAGNAYAIDTATNNLYSWGLNHVNQLGVFDTVDRFTPTMEGGMQVWVSVNASMYHVVGIDWNLNATTWGYNLFDQLGRITAYYVPYKAVSIGQGTFSTINTATDGCDSLHLGAIDSSGRLWMWGTNDYGQIGNGTIDNQYSAVQVGTGTDWKQVSFGRYHTAAIKTNGTLWTWGNNGVGQLGLSNITYRSSPVQVGTGTDWKQVSCGYIHTSAVKTGGSLWSWGGACLGALGNSISATNILSPVQTISAGTTWSQVSCGTYFTAAIKTDGTLWLWGANSYGQLGRSDKVHRSSPIQTLAGGTTWKQVSCAPSHFVAVKTGGTLHGCGDNTYGQLGTSNTTSSSVVVQEVGADTDWNRAISNANCSGGLKTDNSLWYWGSNAKYQCGHVDRGANSKLSPMMPNNAGTDWLHFYFSRSTSVAIKTNGYLYAWGGDQNNDDVLVLDESGIYNSTSQAAIAVGWSDSILWRWRQIYPGYHFTLGLRLDGTLWSWGYNSHGQLGNSVVNSTDNPVQIGTSNTWKKIAGSNYSSYGIKDDGTLWAWGYNGWGQLGISNEINKTTPVQVGTGTDWKQINSNYYHVAAIKTDGTLWTWGYNANGQLGDGTVNYRNSPAQVGANTNWKQVACGDRSTIAIKTDGTLWTWGANSYGELGSNTITNRSSPVQVGTKTNWKYVAASISNMAAIQYETE
jgi:alpha-tubulin suppressor-like RCC1 family protein